MNKVDASIHRLNGFIAWELFSLPRKDRKKVTTAVIKHIQEMEKFGAWDA